MNSYEKIVRIARKQAETHQERKAIVPNFIGGYDIKRAADVEQGDAIAIIEPLDSIDRARLQRGIDLATGGDLDKTA